MIRCSWSGSAGWISGSRWQLEQMLEQVERKQQEQERNR
jgi:hypothetical protein